MNDTGRRHAYPSACPLRDHGGRHRLVSACGRLPERQPRRRRCRCSTSTASSAARLARISSALLRELRMPIVTTLHTILSEPNPAQRLVIDELARLSSRLVVMSTSGADLLQRVHGVARDQIDLIPHGIPDVPVDARSKARLGVDGKTVILTFGLLSPDKGIEYVDRRAAGDPCRAPRHRLHRPRRDASPRDRAPRRGLPAHARGPGAAARRRAAA